MRIATDADALMASIEPGMTLAVCKDESGAAMEAVRALIRRGITDLNVLCVPVCGLGVDLLIGAGCVESIECAGVVLGEFGVGPRFRQAVHAGALTVRDSTCPAIHAALQAGEKGVPFAPVRGILGSDLVAHRPDWKVASNPFAAEPDPILLVPAITPDAFVFHAAWADEQGNVWAGGRRDLFYTAHAALSTYVTVEEMWPGSLLEDERMAAGTLSAAYVTGIAHVPRGAWPLMLAHRYEQDTNHLAEYLQLAQTDHGFQCYLEKYIRNPAQAGT